MIFQPLLFGLIGAEVNFSDVKEATIGKCCLYSLGAGPRVGSSSITGQLNHKI